MRDFRHIFKVNKLVILTGLFFISCYSKPDIKQNYQNKKEDFQLVISSIDSILPVNCKFDIEYKNELRLERLYFSNNSGPDFLEWDLKITKDIPDNVLKSLGWEKSTFLKVYEMLNSINCIGYEHGENITLMYQRSGFCMDMYYFLENEVSYTVDCGAIS